ncbi:hypothetical protein THALO_350073 [Tenacibaculum halocynthiae]
MLAELIAGECQLNEDVLLIRPIEYNRLHVNSTLSIN